MSHINETTTRATVDRFLRAVQQRDLSALEDSFAEDAIYQNVPHPPAVGPTEITAMFAPILLRSERVEWEILSEAYVGPRAHLERIDRFWIDGREYAVPCHAVVVVNTDEGRIASFRDYVDLGLWRATLAGGLDAPPRSSHA